MRRPKTLAEIYADVAAESGPHDLVLQTDEFRRRVAREAGVDVEELERLEATGELDRRVSLELFALTLQAVEALKAEIASGNASPEVLARVALEGPKVAQKLAGRDVQKHLVLSADYWESVLRSSEDASD